MPTTETLTSLRRPATWGTAMGEYFTNMRAAHRSSSTIRLHRHYLNQLLELTRTPWEITSQQLEEVMARPTWQAEARKSARSVFRSFYGWALEQGYIEDDPSAKLPSVRVPRGVPRPAPERVVQEIVADVDDRVSLMAQLAAFAGLRVREIAVVHRDDLIGDVLLVHGKGGHQRLVPIEEPNLLRRLEQLEGYAFPNPSTGEPMTAGHVCKLLSQALPKGWTGHTLRHRFATQALDGTGDLLAVMRLLGHAQPETTMRYCALADDRIRAASRAGSSVRVGGARQTDLTIPTGGGRTW